MYPIIFEYNNFQISSYGFMLMLAFLICNYLLKKYLLSVNIDGKHGENIIFYAAIGGIFGAKIFYIIEYYPTGEGYANLLGLVDMVSGIIRLNFNLFFNGLRNFGSGLVFLGGLIGGMISVSIYAYMKKLSWTVVADWVAPYIILGQGIGRLGCFFVGCCYGLPSNKSWLFSFPHGRPPTTYDSFKYNYPDVFNNFVAPFYQAGDFIKVHPTQLYEFIMYICIFFYLIFKRKHKKYNGQIMCEYLFFAGLSRFIIEIYRLNPIYIMNLTSAQIISSFMILISLIIFANKSQYITIWKK